MKKVNVKLEEDESIWSLLSSLYVIFQSCINFFQLRNSPLFSSITFYFVYILYPQT